MYFHRKTPQPSTTSEAEAAVVEEEEDDMGAQSVEMEFPSGYSDPWPEEKNEVCVCVGTLLSRLLGSSSNNLLLLYYSIVYTGHRLNLRSNIL